MPRARILVADDHSIVRRALIQMLKGESTLDADIVGEAVDGADAVEKAGALRPDIVLMDVSMPRMNGIEATKEVVARCPEVKVIGLSMHNDEAMGATMREAGASSYVSKSDSPEKLVGVIHEVLGKSA